MNEESEKIMDAFDRSEVNWPGISPGSRKAKKPLFLSCERIKSGEGFLFIIRDYGGGHCAYLPVLPAVTDDEQGTLDQFVDMFHARDLTLPAVVGVAPQGYEIWLAHAVAEMCKGTFDVVARDDEWILEFKCGDKVLLRSDPRKDFDEIIEI